MISLVAAASASAKRRGCVAAYGRRRSTSAFDYAVFNRGWRASRRFSDAQAIKCTTLKSHTAATAMRADAGIVKIQATTIPLATPHRTAETRTEDPTPMIAPVIVCVVETGIPK